MKDPIDRRSSAAVLAEILALVGSIDGISTADAMQLGSLIQEYGSAKSGESIGPIMTALLDGALKQPPKKPWESP